MISALLLLSMQQPVTARLEVSPAQADVQVGRSLQLTARVLDPTGAPIPGARVVWFGGGFNGSVDSTGLVRGGYRGSIRAIAIATAPGAKRVTSDVLIRVLPGPPARIDLRPAATTLPVGGRVTLVGTVWTAENDSRADTVTYSSASPRIASVTPEGQVTAVAPGTAVVTAKAGGATGTVTVKVVPNTVASLTVSSTASTVRTGDVVKFTAAVKDRTGRPIEGLTVRWLLAAVSNVGTAEIDDDGVFVADEQGIYTVTAMVGTQSADAVVRVVPRAVGRGIEVVGRLPLPVRGAEIWVHPNGKCVYYSTISDRLYAIDVSDPSKPVIADSMTTDARLLNDVMTTEDGKYGVFSREGSSVRKNGIVVFDASNPCHPKPIADYTETVSGGVHSSFVYQGHVYLTDDATGSMRVISIKDPYHPREVGRWQTSQTDQGRYVHDIDIKDGIAYLSYLNDGLVILDIGNGMKGGTPEKPVQISQLKYDLEYLYRRVEQRYGLGPRGTHTAWRHGKYVFVGDEVYAAKPAKGLESGNDLTWGRLQVVDVSDIEKPKIVAWYEPTDGGVHNIWIEGDSLYVGNYQGGGRVVDISGDLKGDLLRQGREIAWLFTADSSGTRPRATFTWGAVVKNGLIYYNDINSGLWITRLESKQRPIP
ncbi:MAG: Ig-like domain-containing protein [Gemmatimonadota bacterium]